MNNVTVKISASRKPAEQIDGSTSDIYADSLGESFRDRCYWACSRVLCLGIVSLVKLVVTLHASVCIISGALTHSCTMNASIVHVPSNLRRKESAAVLMKKIYVNRHHIARFALRHPFGWTCQLVAWNLFRHRAINGITTASLLGRLSLHRALTFLDEVMEKTVDQGHRSVEQSPIEAFVLDRI